MCLKLAYLVAYSVTCIWKFTRLICFMYVLLYSLLDSLIQCKKNLQLMISWSCHIRQTNINFGLILPQTFSQAQNPEACLLALIKHSITLNTPCSQSFSILFLYLLTPLSLSLSHLFDLIVGFLSGIFSPDRDDF